MSITELIDIKLMWAITDGRAALLVSMIFLRKQECGVTQWEVARGENIVRQENDGMGH